MKTEQEFITKLSESLSFLSVEDRQEIVESYQLQFQEMRAKNFDDEMIIASLEPIATIVANVKQEFDDYEQTTSQNYKEKFSHYRSQSKEKVNDSNLKLILKKICQVMMVLSKIIISIGFIISVCTLGIIVFLLQSFFGISFVLFCFIFFTMTFLVTSFILCWRFVNYLGGLL